MGFYLPNKIASHCILVGCKHLIMRNQVNSISLTLLNKLCMPDSRVIKSGCATNLHIYLEMVCVKFSSNGPYSVRLYKQIPQNLKTHTGAYCHLYVYLNLHLWPHGKLLMHAPWTKTNKEVRTWFMNHYTWNANSNIDWSITALLRMSLIVLA